MVSYGLYVEVAVLALLVVLAVVSLVLVLLGAILSFPTGPPPENGQPAGEPLVNAGEWLVNAGLLVVLGLAALLVVHAVAEAVAILRSDHAIDLGRPAGVAYAAVRVVESGSALTLLGVWAVGFVLSTAGFIGGEPSDTAKFVLLASGVAMPASVVLHALGRGVRAVADGW